MYLYRATGDPYLLEVGEDILKSIQYSAKTSCGYATIKNVRDHRKQDTMESFFLAETTKYLYLLFDPDNFLNSDGGYGTVLETQNGECIIESSYIFNTEAHPIDVGALKCCYDVPRESLVKGFNRQKFLGNAASHDKSNLKPMEVLLDENGNEGESTESFKKALVGEIMNALTNTKKRIEENVELQKRFIEITKREKDGSFNVAKNVVDLGTSPKRILPVQPEKKISPSTEKDDTEQPIEIVKLPSGALETDNVDTKKKTADIDEKTSSEKENLTSQSKDNKKEIESNASKPPEANNSILSDFVQAILKSASRKVKKFDPQTLLEKIRESGFPRNESWTQRFELLTCKAQPYLQRISVIGEFY